MNHFTLDQIIELQIRIYYNKNKGCATAKFSTLTKEDKVVNVQKTEIKDQYSPNQKF